MQHTSAGRCANAARRHKGISAHRFTDSLLPFFRSRVKQLKRFPEFFQKLTVPRWELFADKCTKFCSS